MNKLLIILILSLFTIKANAQLLEGNDKSRLGLQMGFGVSSFYGDEFEKYRPYLGYKFGIYHKIKLGDKMYLRYGVLGDLKGSKFKVYGDSSVSKVTTMYVSVPIDISYVYRKNDKAENEFYIGGQYSRLLVSRMFKGIDIRPTETNIALKKYDVGLALGHQWNRVNWGFRLGVYYGIIDLNEGLNYRSIPGLKRTNKPVGFRSLNFGFVF